MNMQRKKLEPGSRKSIYFPQDVPAEIIDWVNAQTDLSNSIIKLIALFVHQHGNVDLTKKHSLTDMLTSFVGGELASAMSPLPPLSVPEPKPILPPEEPELVDSKSYTEPERQDDKWIGTDFDEDGFM